MKKTVGALFVMIVGLFALSGPALAHHGTAVYDANRHVSVQGMVTRFEFSNPHAVLAVSVRSANGNVVEWEGEMTSPNHLQRTGWTKNTLKIGDQVTLSGTPSKSGSNTMVIHKVLKEGQEIQLTTE